MKRLWLVALAGALIAAQDARAQGGFSLGAAVGSSWQDNKLQLDDERHGLLYLKFGLPLVPYGARGDFLVWDDPAREYDTGVIGSLVMGLDTPLIQPYALVGYGRYGLRSTQQDGWSYGAGLRIGGRRGLFIEGRRHDPINRDLVSVGLAF